MLRSIAALQWMLIAPLALAAPPDLAERVADLEKSLAASFSTSHAAGASVAIVVDDQVALLTAFGMRDVDAALPMTPDTLLAIGSTTKAFTALLIAQQIDEGKMGWDDLVRTHVPEFHLKDPQADAQVTIRDLLCHRTGLLGQDLLWYGAATTFEDFVPCIAAAEAKEPFRAKWQYHNLMFVTAGEATSRVTGRPWGDLLRARVLGPLGMQRSNIDLATMRADSDHARGYRWDEKENAYKHMPMRDLSHIAPAGAINSSAREMVQWLRLQLGRGEIGGQRLVAAERFDEMWAPQIDIAPTSKYALGWAVGELEGHRIIEHTGGIDGFSALVALLPDDRTGFVILTNAQTNPWHAIARTLIPKALFGPRAAEGAAPAASEEFAPYLGKYDLDVLKQAVTVLERSGGLAIDVPGQMIFDLESPDEQGRRKFKGFPDIALSFNRDAEGVVVSLSMYQSGLTFEAPKQGVARADETDPATLAEFEGSYRVDGAPATAPEFKVLTRPGGRLAIDVPGEMIYELYPPDAEGWWVFRAIAGIRLRFERDGAGAISALWLKGAAGETKLSRLAPAAGLPTIEEVEALVHERCGATAFEQIPNLRLTGTIDLVHQGVRGSWTYLFSGYDRRYEKDDLGKFGWMENAGIGNLVFTRSSSEPLEQLDDRRVTEYWHLSPFRLYDLWSSYFKKITVVSVSENAGRRLIELRGEKEGLEPATWWVDAENGQLARTRQSMHGPAERPGTVTIEISFDDYRSVGGAMIPFRITYQHPAMGHVVCQATAFEVDVELLDEIWILDERLK